MRMNSRKQTAASRANGSRSKGPKSTRGKNQVRLNALSDGISSKSIVIESAGERVEDFEALKKRMWDFFGPTNPLEEMLVTDIVENYWRRRRVRYCETTELNNKFKAQEIRDRLERAKRVQSLKAEYLARFQDLLGARIENLFWRHEVREELASTSLGMDYLICEMRCVKDQVTADGYLSKQSDAIMQACGIDIPTIMSCEQLSSEAKKELEQTPEGTVREEATSINQSEVDTDQGTTKNKKPKRYSRKSSTSKMLLETVLEAIATLEGRKKTLGSVEQIEARTRSAMALLPADSVDRFSRAETAFERRMYRALGTLLTLRGVAGRGVKLPELAE
jgi:hypothetical protein